MTEELIKRLKELADKYETKDFLNDDPSQFLRWYSETRDIEIASFIASLLSFGSRSQFIPKIKQILTLADKHNGIYDWIKSGIYQKEFNSLTVCGVQDSNEKKFYRFYSYSDFIQLFGELQQIIKNGNTLGEFVQEKYEESIKENSSVYLSDLISSLFKSKIIPHGKNTANKRVNMFVRWMVRDNSPVDIGIWTWYDKRNLLLPLDTHVIQESIKMEIILEKSKADRKTAMELSEKMRQIWPDDPCKGDFALFGYGVDDNN